MFVRYTLRYGSSLCSWHCSADFHLSRSHLPRSPNSTEGAPFAPWWFHVYLAMAKAGRFPLLVLLGDWSKQINSGLGAMGCIAQIAAAPWALSTEPAKGWTFIPDCHPIQNQCRHPELCDTPPGAALNTSSFCISFYWAVHSIHQELSRKAAATLCHLNYLFILVPPEIFITSHVSNWINN